MFEFIHNIVFNFFLHIEVNTLNLPYINKLPRPNKANKVSKFLRQFFEKRFIRRFFGLNLASAMLAVTLIGSPGEDLIYEPPLNIDQTDLVINDSVEIPLTTKVREHLIPVKNLRYIGQGYRSGHAAYDLNSSIGSDIVAFTSGRVHKVNIGQFGLGKYIILDHGQGLTSIYAHLRSFSVELGQVVKTGQKIGEVGMTGYTTGPHLHFEIHDNGSAINPRTYLGI